jgi:HK97 family phage major capsid protein
MPFAPNLSERPSLNEVRSALMEGGDYLNGLRSVPAAERSDSWREDVRSATEQIRLLDPLLTALEGGSGPVAATGDHSGPEARSLGEQLVTADGFAEFVTSKRASASFFEAELRADITSTTDAEWVPVAPTRIPPRLRARRNRIRDLVSVQSTGLASIPYIRENYTTNGVAASFTAEGAAKAEQTIEFTSDDAPARKITAWVPVTTEIIEDAPTLRGYIDNRLLNKIALAEDNAIISGNGTAPNLRGILNFAGIQSIVADEVAAWVAGSTNRFEKLGLAIGKVEAVDGEADGIVMHPSDYWAMMVERQTAQFDAGGAYQSAPFGGAAMAGLDPWGLPVVRSTAITTGTALVGSWTEGATLFDRSQVSIRVGNQHSDYFTTNKVAIVAEERLALAVHRPDLFVTVAINAVAT